MNIEFSGKRAVVTGAGKGIGRGIAVALDKGGAETFAISRTQADLDSLKSECPKIHTICVDISDWEATRKAVQDIGQIDLLVNNAAVAIIAQTLEATPEQYDRVMNTNVKAVINISQVAIKGMIERKIKGSIVNISSQCAQRPLKDFLYYNISKAALDMVTKTLAYEFGEHQIRVNSVNPTGVLTEMGKQYWVDSAPNTQAMLARIPQRRFAEIQDVVNAVLYVLSDKADMINGAQLPVDGGFLAW